MESVFNEDSFQFKSFYVVSSMAIADIHGLDWYKDQLDLLELKVLKRQFSV